MTSVLIADPNGDVELLYDGDASAENLVKEIRYYPSPDSLRDTLSVTPMKQGMVEGVVRAFHPDNLVREETPFVAGRQEGVFRRYDSEGVLVFEGLMRSGSREGVWTTWYDAVQMEEQRAYLNDRLHGKWSFWYADGNLRRDETYESGILVEGKDYD